MDSTLVSITTILVSIGQQYYYFGKHLEPFCTLKYFIPVANQTREIWVDINHSYTKNSVMKYVFGIETTFEEHSFQS